MGFCNKRHFLLTICTLQLITTTERQVFDFLGYMWVPILVNFFNIIFVILGFFGAFQYRSKYIIVYCVWNVLWFGWNVFLICFYLDAGGLDKTSDILNFGTGSFSWWLINGPGCNPYFNRTIDRPDFTRPERPESVTGCVLNYEVVEVIHASTQCLLAVMAVINGIFLNRVFMEEDDSFDFVGGGDFGMAGHTPLHPMYVSYSALPPAAAAHNKPTSGGNESYYYPTNTGTTTASSSTTLISPPSIDRNAPPSYNKVPLPPPQRRLVPLDPGHQRPADDTFLSFGRSHNNHHQPQQIQLQQLQQHQLQHQQQQSQHQPQQPQPQQQYHQYQQHNNRPLTTIDYSVDYSHPLDQLPTNLQHRPEYDTLETRTPDLSMNRQTRYVTTGAAAAATRALPQIPQQQQLPPVTYSPLLRTRQFNRVVSGGNGNYSNSRQNRNSYRPRIYADHIREQQPPSPVIQRHQQLLLQQQQQQQQQHQQQQQQRQQGQLRSFLSDPRLSIEDEGSYENPVRVARNTDRTRGNQSRLVRRDGRPMSMFVNNY